MNCQCAGNVFFAELLTMCASNTHTQGLLAVAICQVSTCWCLDARTFCPVFCKSSHSKESSSRNLERSPSLWCFCSTSCCLLGWAVEGMDRCVSTSFHIPYLGVFSENEWAEFMTFDWRKNWTFRNVLGELLSLSRFLNEPYEENLARTTGTCFTRRRSPESLCVNPSGLPGGGDNPFCLG